MVETARLKGIEWPLEETVSNEMLMSILFPDKYESSNCFLEPDYEFIHKELAKPGVTMTLLWNEYRIKCEECGKRPYMSTQFGDKYRRWARITKATMRIHHKPGDVFEANRLAAEYDLKFIVGAEFYFVKDRKSEDKTNAHIIVMAMTENGREAVNDIQSEANLTGFYYKPRVDLELLLSLPEDEVVVTTACIGGIWKYDDYDDIIKTLHQKFGRHLYIEVQPHNNEKQAELNRRILGLHKKYDIGLIAGTDSHYIYPEQSQLRNDLIVSLLLTARRIRTSSRKAPERTAIIRTAATYPWAV